MAEPQQEPFVAPESTQEFKHLFPPTGQITPTAVETPVTLSPSVSEQTNSSTPSIVTSNGGIDYVIVFKFPTTVPKSDDKTTRAELEASILSSLASITLRLTKVNLRFQVRPGKEEGTLLILISSPVGPIKQEYRQER